jgi:biotin carboxyl carrier protein
MKLTLTLQHGSRSSQHQIDLRGIRKRTGEASEIFLDGESIAADWAEVSPGIYSIVLGGRSYEARVMNPPGPAGSGRGERSVTVGSRHYGVTVHDPRRRETAHTLGAARGPQEVTAPMPGKIVRVLVEKNQDVAQGAGLLVIEAMKMQNELRAPRAGRVEEIYVAEGLGVDAGARLVRLT